MAAEIRHHYKVLELLDRGGMAEVYRALAETPDGREVEVAIKRLLPSLTQDHHFIQLFLDETRLSMMLRHPNIVQVVDVGTSNDDYYLVMEYVDGLNLWRILRQVRRRDRQLPVPMALFVVSEVLKGLHYAHELRGADGRHLKIVHRDVTPGNVLITTRGQVKITDFGLAKATTQTNVTEPGIVKGKFGYVAPESLMGLPPDRRVDVFAAGVVLWECLAGRRLFTAKNPRDAIEQLRQWQLPDIRDFNAKVDEDLRAIIYGALVRDRDRRYSSAKALLLDIDAYRASQGYRVTPYHASRLVHWALEIEQSEAPYAPNPL